ncbi:ribonuclease Z [Candidatus Pacearchaeota archaeon]|nr:ribonuclease Z [Candidatus Pacearchaeota archaeon]
MKPITLTFLGTSNAVPTELRNHTAILASFDAEAVLIDCGEGTQRQFKQAGISPHKLTRILITHWHGDHILGLPGLFQTLAMSDYRKTLHLYGPHGTKYFISLIQQLMGKLRIQLEVHEVSPGKIIDEPEFFIEAAAMHHDTPTLAYALIIKDKRRLNKQKLKKLKIPNSPMIKELQRGKDIVLNGRKIRASQVSYIEKGKKLACILDTGMNAHAVQLAKEADLLICESSFSEEETEKAKEYFHLTAGDAATIAKKAKAKALILTHISQRYEHNLKKIENEARKIFKNTRIARDLDVIIV